MPPRHFVKRILIIAACIASSACLRLFQPSPDQCLKLADQSLKEGNYELAIQTYNTHMQERLAVQNRPQSENPYFYEVLIGDAYLNWGKPDLALESYEKAGDKAVDRKIVADRIRLLAAWYRKHGELKQAIAVLDKYRMLDPLIMDSVLDDTAKELTNKGN